jgi:hypothetical protein
MPVFGSILPELTTPPEKVETPATAMPVLPDVIVPELVTPPRNVKTERSPRVSEIPPTLMPTPKLPAEIVPGFEMPPPATAVPKTPVPLTSMAAFAPLISPEFVTAAPKV